MAGSLQEEMIGTQITLKQHEKQQTNKLKETYIKF